MVWGISVTGKAIGKFIFEIGAGIVLEYRAYSKKHRLSLVTVFIRGSKDPT